ETEELPLTAVFAVPEHLVRFFGRRHRVSAVVVGARRIVVAPRPGRVAPGTDGRAIVGGSAVASARGVPPGVVLAVVDGGAERSPCHGAEEGRRDVADGSHDRHFALLTRGGLALRFALGRAGERFAA